MLSVLVATPVLKLITSPRLPQGMLAVKCSVAAGGGFSSGQSIRCCAAFSSALATSRL